MKAHGKIHARDNFIWLVHCHPKCVLSNKLPRFTAFQMHCPVYVPFTWPSPFPIFPTDDTDNTQRKKLKPFQKTKANKFIGLFGNKVDFNCNHKRPNKMSVFFGILSVKPCDTRFVP